MTGRSAAGPCGGGGVCQQHLAARIAACDSPAGDGGRTDDVELSIALSDDTPGVVGPITQVRDEVVDLAGKLNHCWVESW